MERLWACFCAWDLQGPHSKSAPRMTLPQSPAQCGQLALPHVGCQDLGSLLITQQWLCHDSTFSSGPLQFITEVVRGVQHPSPTATPCFCASGPTGSSLCSQCYPEVRFSSATSQNDWPLHCKGTRTGLVPYRQKDSCHTGQLWALAWGWWEGPCNSTQLMTAMPCHECTEQTS